MPGSRVSATFLPASSRQRVNRSLVAATRSSAARPGDHPRPPPSRRIFPAAVGVAFAIDRAAKLKTARRGRATRSCMQFRRRVRQSFGRHRVVQYGCILRYQGLRCRCFSSAKTMDWESAFARRAAGSNPPLAPGRTCDTWRSMGTTRWLSATSRPSWRIGCVETASRRSYTCARCAMAVMPAPTSKRHTGRLSNCAPTPREIRSSALHGRCPRVAGRGPTCCNATTKSPSWCTRSPLIWGKPNS